jgi:L-ascorbate metabolism protein UlaG (beta-lactamase superfamily)
MDHFDLPTLKCFPASTRAVSARATGDLLKKTRLKQVTELGWGQKAVVATRAGTVNVTAFEVKHWGARWRRDTYRGYNGYILEREGKKILFGGDTAMSATFKPLHSQGPFALAVMPIGAYQPWVCSHCTPEQAVRMADEAGAKHFLPIHHKTFALGREKRSEPLARLESILEKERLALREIGGTFRAS